MMSLYPLPIALVGMACHLPGTPNSAELWRRYINQYDPGPAVGTQTYGGEFDTGAGFLSALVNAALEDAGLSIESLGRRTTGLFVGLEAGAGEPVDHQVWRHLLPELGIENGRVAVEPCSGGFAPMLERGLDSIRSGKQALCLLVQAASPVSGTGFALILQSAGGALDDKRSAYALFKGFESLAAPSAANGTAGPPKDALTDIGMLVVPPADEFSLEPGKTAPWEAIRRCPDHHQAIQPYCYFSVDGVRGTSDRGCLSLMLTALGVNHKLIPPSSGSDPFGAVGDKPPFFANTEPRPWIHDPARGPRRAGVLLANENGTGGLVLMEEVKPGGETRVPVSRETRVDLAWDSELFVLSAPTVPAMQRTIDSLHSFIDRCSGDLNCADLAYSLLRRFEAAAACRVCIVSKSIKHLGRALDAMAVALAGGDPVDLEPQGIYFSDPHQPPAGKIACLFPGLGFPGLLGSYADHLLELALHFPIVRQVLDGVECRGADPDPSSQIMFPPTAFSEEARHRLLQRMASPRVDQTVNQDREQRPNLATFAVTVANWCGWRLLKQLGLQPDFFFGQSLGEVSGLCAAGATDFDQFIRLHWQMELMPEHLVDSGQLALVSATESTLAPYLARHPDVAIAIHMAPQSLILGGPAEQLQSLILEMRKKNIYIQLLPYPAVHTPHLSSMHTLVAPLLAQLSIRSPIRRAYSGMTAEAYPDDPVEIRRIVSANLDHPLLSWQTIRKLYRDGARFFIQVGGGAHLDTHAKANIGSDDICALSLEVSYRSGIGQLNHLLAELVARRVPLKLDYLYRHRTVHKLDMGPVTGCAPSEIGLQAHGDPDSPGTLKSLELEHRDLRMPFMGHVRRHLPRDEIVVERVLDLNLDRFIKDHLFVNSQGSKPVSACLPVLPMTMSMEIMAEVAACLSPGWGLIGFEDIKANRWIALVDSDTRRLRITARMSEPEPGSENCRVAVRIQSLPQTAPAVEAVVLLGRRYQVRLALNFSTPQMQSDRHPFEGDRVYRERHLFHGPLFQCIAGDTVIARRHVGGMLAVLPKADMFHDLQRPQLLTDPVLLDGVGQLIGLWAMDRGVYVFPIGIRKLEVYGPTPPVGTRVPVNIEIKQFGAKLLQADVEIQNGAGRVWMRIENWRDWIFRWPRSLVDFRRYPQRYCTSRNLEPSDLTIRSTVKTISRKDLRDMDLDVAARHFLHTEEMGLLRRGRPRKPDQWQWLLGRIAAKDAARDWIATHMDEDMLHPVRFQINGPKQGPLKVVGLPAKVRAPHVLIGQSNGNVIAIAHPGDQVAAVRRFIDKWKSKSGPDKSGR